MAHFEEQTGQPYDWGEGGVYVIEREDPVDGGLDGVSNRQGRELTRRTRNLHGRLATSEGEIDTLQEALPIAAEAAKNVAVGLAKAHTDQAAAAVRNEMAVGDQAALNTAKAYADRIVAALVDNSPELLNTLEELAAALGGDPEFATTVLTQIGGKITSAIEVRTKAAFDELTRTLVAGIFEIQTNETPFGAIGAVVQRMHTWSGGNWEAVQLFMGITNGEIKFRRVTNGIQQSIVELYHSGNLNPASHSKMGLMSAADKIKLDGLANYTHPDDGNTRHVTDQNIANWNNKVDGWAKLYNRADFNESTRLTQSGISLLQTTDTPFGEFGAVIQRQNSWGGGAWECVQLFMGITTPKVMVRRVNFQGEASLVELHHSGNLKIIRGAVNANSNGIWCSGGEIDKIEPNYVKVTHNIGHTRYSATATAHAETILVRGDNVVTVFTKAASYTTFIVTDGEGNSNEPTAFDFIIIAE